MRFLLLLAASAAWTQNLHPDFSFSAAEIVRLTRGMEFEARENIAKDPGRFLGLLSSVLADDPYYTVLVDKRHALPAGYEPADLVSLNSYRVNVSRADLKLRESIMPAVLALAQAAREAGAELLFSSSYRSYSYQEGLFNRYAARDGVEAANRYSARAGQSQHQLGTVFDLGDITNAFAGTRAGRWMTDNAHRFGFSLSFPRGYENETGYQWESWHWRYIGVAGCTLQREYFGNLQHRFLEWLHEARPTLEAAWKGRAP